MIQVVNKFNSIPQSWHQVDYIMNHIIDQDQLKIFINLQSPNPWSKFGSLNAWFHLKEIAYLSHQWIFLKMCLKVLKEDRFWLLLKIREEL